MNSSEPPIRYVLIESDLFEADHDRIALSNNTVLGPERANLWEEGLDQALRGLTGFPGPLSHSRDEDASDLYRREVRRLLYHGPNRRSKQPARILFTLIPPSEDEPDGETVVSLLRLLRGGQSLRGAEEDDARS